MLNTIEDQFPGGTDAAPSHDLGRPSSEGNKRSLSHWERVGVRAFGFLQLLPLSRHSAAAAVRRRIVVVLVLVLAPPVSLAAERDPDYDYDPPAPGTYTLPVVKPAAPGALLD